jgi:hypothetical protein
MVEICHSLGTGQLSVHIRSGDRSAIRSGTMRFDLSPILFMRFDLSPILFSASFSSSSVPRNDGVEMAEFGLPEYDWSLRPALRIAVPAWLRRRGSRSD